MLIVQLRLAITNSDISIILPIMSAFQYTSHYHTVTGNFYTECINCPHIVISFFPTNIIKSVAHKNTDGHGDISNII